ncbi:MAG TPA: hypothetical protein VF752_04885 [Thermoleophilaceae bacterium]
MADWATISALATAGGTLALAAATYGSVRSANRSARTAEIALQEQRRPVLVQSRLDDAEQKIMFVDRHWARVSGGGGTAEHSDGVLYLVLSLRNVGLGIAVLQGWHARAGLARPDIAHAELEEMRPQTRDLYIPAGDIGLWQGAFRDQHDAGYPEIARALDDREPISIDLLYTDQIGDQRTISRFVLNPVGDDRWIASVGRHWYLDRAGPR